jgi:hypothetical protein
MSRPSSTPLSRALVHSRRSLLKGLGMAVPAVALPVLRSSPLYAQTAPVRLIVLFKGNGTIEGSFWPGAPGANYTLPAGGILEPLMPFRAKMNVLKGVHYDSGDKFVNAAAHQKGPVACLTGAGPTPGRRRRQRQLVGVRQQHLRRPVHRQQVGGEHPLKTMELGVGIRGVSNRNRISYLGNNQPVGTGGRSPPRPSPGVQQLHPGRAHGHAGRQRGRGDEEPGRRKSVLDFVRADLGRLSPRLPADERPRLERHLESLRELERSLSNPSTSTAGPACKPARRNDVGRGGLRGPEQGAAGSAVPDPGL